MTKVDGAKQVIRERVWALLEREHAAPPGVHGRIPAFFGADTAGDRLTELSAWRAAKVVKAVPDTAQQPVRARALREGKLLYMAVPKLAAELPFFRLDPTASTVPPMTRRTRTSWPKSPPWSE
jgi:5-formyltetrahydrofolate cyclo-ligase